MLHRFYIYREGKATKQQEKALIRTTEFYMQGMQNDVVINHYNLVFLIQVDYSKNDMSEMLQNSREQHLKSRREINKSARGPVINTYKLA